MNLVRKAGERLLRRVFRPILRQGRLRAMVGTILYRYMQGRSPIGITLPFARLFLILLCAGTVASPTNLRADGCFVFPPFVWNNVSDVNEPTQKAILLYDSGREDMILQVGYAGPVAQFGWLIPVPSRPEIGTASMASFYELSRQTQEFIYRRLQWRRFAYGGAQNQADSPPTVNVIEYKTVGRYDVAVLETESPSSLTAWLAQNHFAFRAGSQSILRPYLAKHWFMVAIRVHLEASEREETSPKSSSQESVQSKASQALRSGELHPLKISFDTPNCIFPLKISSANGKASEVLLYVLSAEPFTCPGLIKSRHVPEFHGPGYDLAPELDSAFPAGVLQADRLPKCRADLPRLAHRKWAFVKFQRLLQPREMRDLTFESVFPLLRGYLEGAHSYQARSSLGYFEELASPLWPDLAQSPNVDNRIDCCTSLHAYPHQQSSDLVLKLMDDSDLNVRFQACWAAECYHDARVISKLVEKLNDPADGAIRRTAALSCGKLGVRDPRVIAALIDLLDNPYPTPQDEAQAALVKITGQKLKSQQQWREWWGTNHTSFAAP